MGGCMLIAVTGGMGFIGQEVVSRLLARGHRVVVADHWDTLVSRYEHCQHSILESVYQTLPAIELLLRPREFHGWLVGSSPDAVVHLGAVVDTTDMGSEGLFQSNVDFTRDLVRACCAGRQTRDVPGIVFASSAAVYGSLGCPNNPYGLTKALGESLVSQSRGEFVTLRLFNVFGRHEAHKGAMASVPFKLAAAYRRGDRFDMHSLDSARDFVPVTTVADKLIAYAEMLAERDEDEPTVKYVMDLGTGHATTFRDLDNFVMQASHAVSSCVREVPIPDTVVGRFQHYTCAGERVSNAGSGSITTREALEEIYGNKG